MSAQVAGRSSRAGRCYRADRGFVRRGAADAVPLCLPRPSGRGRGPSLPARLSTVRGLSSVRADRVASPGGVRPSCSGHTGSAAMTATHPTRLETRTKESNARASQRVDRNPAAQ